jgi:hypothetical protein
MVDFSRAARAALASSSGVKSSHDAQAAHQSAHDAGNMRALGGRRLSVQCLDPRCRREALLEVDCGSDDVPVKRSGRGWSAPSAA